jgi:uncharacterized protein (DUF488 family)
VATVFTIGHSTRDLASFSRVLQAHDIRLLEDIRAFPMSRRHPHFNREHLELWLPEIGTDYVWEKDLGGRRGKQMPADQSPNIAMRNPSFRNYADYMLTDKFHTAVQRLVERAEKGHTAIMCAELLYFRCHRMLVSDFLVSKGHTVLHIADENAPKEHTLTKEARIIDGQLVYRGDYLL